MRINQPVKYAQPVTAEGAPAMRIGPEQELRRLAATCMLWEDNFYIDGVSVADRIHELVGKVSPEFAAAVAYEARTKQKLRHLPLHIVREMARLPLHRKLVGALLPDVIQRADEITEFVAMYWKDGRQPLSKQVKVGLAKAFLKFDEYALAKYNHDGAVKLRDVLFLCHAKPDNAERDALWKRLINNELQTPDTWEVALSGGADKRETFMRLMAEGKLFGLAFLRNMRNMYQAGVDSRAVSEYGAKLDFSRVLPFRFIAAARAVPAWEHIIEPMMLRAMPNQEKLAGHTVILLDVSGSMDSAISAKSDLYRVDASCGLAILLREICQSVQIYTFSQHVEEVPLRHGFALRDAILKSQPHGSTYLGQAVNYVKALATHHDRLIVLSDEQSHDRVSSPNASSRGYMINVAAHRHGVGYGKWHHIDGWSEAVIDYIRTIEA